MTASTRKHRLIIDVDGVLRDYIGSVNRVYQREYPDHTIKAVDSRQLEDFYPLGKKIYQFLDGELAWEILADAPEYPGAIEALHRWENEFDIIIGTAQPREWRYPTLAWLGNHRVPGSAVYFSYDKFRIPGIAILDDFEDNLEKFAATGRLAVCLDQPWNRRWNGPRVKTVEEFFGYVCNYLQEADLDDDVLLA